MMRNHLFINKRGDEMEQPVLNLKTAKLSKPRLLSPQHSAPVVDGNPACHNHQPLWTKWSIESLEMRCARGSRISPLLLLLQRVANALGL